MTHFSGDALEITALISILRLNFMGINRSCDIILFYDNTVKVNKGFGDHIHPLVGKSLGFFSEAITKKSRPG